MTLAVEMTPNTKHMAATLNAMTFLDRFVSNMA